MTTSTITTKYQATIPKEVRLTLGARIGDKVLYKKLNPQERKAEIEIISTSNVVEELAGSLNPGGRIKYIPIEIARKKAGLLLAKRYGVKKGYGKSHSH